MAERKRVLVTFASKMGSTQETAEFVGTGSPDVVLAARSI